MELYNFVFHYNTHEGLWYAIHRDRYADYWNGERDIQVGKPIYFSIRMKDVVNLIIDNEQDDE